MQTTALEGEAYLDAFMSGFEFVLLAMRGRLQEAALPAGERARIEAFLADYARLADAYRTRRPAPSEGRPKIVGPIMVGADVIPVN